MPKNGIMKIIIIHATVADGFFLSKKIIEKASKKSRI
jgi:uncharacterized protein YneF (UPF0154 family)